MQFCFDCIQGLDLFLILTILILSGSFELLSSCCRSVDAVVPTQIHMITTNQLAIIQQGQRAFGGPAQLAVCGHAFCKNCLSSWRQYNPACPTCRFDLLGRIERPLQVSDRIADTKCTICWEGLRLVDALVVATSDLR